MTPPVRLPMNERIIYMTDRVWIPKMPKDRIRKLAERIVPIVRFAEGEDGLAIGVRYESLDETNRQMLEAHLK